MGKKSARYGEHLETLVALVSHLAMTQYKSRTPSILTSDLALDYDEVKFILQNFKGLFRESSGTAKGDKDKGAGVPEHYYWLQLRYARWYIEEAQVEGQNKQQPPLEPEYLTSLLDFISRMVDIEKAGERQVGSNRIVLIASVLAFIASIIATIVAYNATLISAVK